MSAAQVTQVLLGNVIWSAYENLLRSALNIWHLSEGGDTARCWCKRNTGQHVLGKIWDDALTTSVSWPGFAEAPSFLVGRHRWRSQVAGVLICGVVSGLWPSHPGRPSAAGPHPATGARVRLDYAESVSSPECVRLPAALRRICSAGQGASWTSSVKLNHSASTFPPLQNSHALVHPTLG